MKKNKIATFHRKNIIEAADNLFREFGFENTTVGMIAKLSNYSTATIYVYFKNKDEIFYCLVFRCMKEIKKNIINILNSDHTFEAKFYDICNAVVKIQKANPIYFEGMIGNINMNLENKETPQIYRDIYILGNDINEYLLQLVKEGIKCGYISETVEKRKLIFYMWSSVTGIVRMAEQKKDYFLLNSITKDELTDFSFKSLLNSIKK